MAEKTERELQRTLAFLEEETLGLTAGLVLISFKDGAEPLFLALESGKSRYTFPGGRMNTGETLLETAVRETREEILGIEEIDFPWGSDSKRTRIYGKQEQRQAVYFLARTDQSDLEVAFNFSKERQEHRCCHWLTAEQARTRLKKRLLPLLDWACDKIHET
ncbi:MAG: NUDIX domain-containing protein [Gammaproteobacteria bacterium]|nr:NUDIX domain-containing protein [Gammaproteobacteria bacterium]